MAKIFKAFQVKIDSEKKTSVPTGLKPPAPPPKEKRNDEEDQEFQELSPELLAGKGEQLKVEESEETSSSSAEGKNDENIKPPQPLKHSVPGSSLARKSLELAALEDKLKGWEQSLLERESAQTKAEEEFHNEMLNRRKAIEQEAAKIMEMAKKSAENLLSSGKAEAESIKKSVQIEVESIRTKSYKEGFALGEEKGVAEGEKSGYHEAKLDWQNLMQETETLIAELQTSRMGLLKAAEEEMVKLIIAFAKRIIKTEPILKPAIILSNIDAALNKVADVDKIVLRINLKDKAMTESHKTEFLKRLSTVSELRILEDESLSPGGVKIETGVGMIDASIEMQAQELENAMLKYLNRGE